MGDVIRRDFGGLAEIAERGAKPQPCRHLSTVVCEVNRTVGCSTCGAPLDPIKVLLEYARHERHWRHWVHEVDVAKARLKEIHAEERKAKARLRHALRKDAAVAVAEERVRTERMRMDIIELARDLGQASRRLEQLAQRRTP